MITLNYKLNKEENGNKLINRQVKLDNYVWGNWVTREIRVKKKIQVKKMPFLPEHFKHQLTDVIIRQVNIPSTFVAFR